MSDTPGNRIQQNQTTRRVGGGLDPARATPEICAAAFRYISDDSVFLTWDKWGFITPVVRMNNVERQGEIAAMCIRNLDHYLKTVNSPATLRTVAEYLNQQAAAMDERIPIKTDACKAFQLRTRMETLTRIQAGIAKENPSIKR